MRLPSKLAAGLGADSWGETLPVRYPLWMAVVALLCSLAVIQEPFLHRQLIGQLGGVGSLLCLGWGLWSGHRHADDPDLAGPPDRGTS